MRVNLNIDGAPITSRSHTHPSHSQVSRLLTSSLSLGVPVPHTTECVRGLQIPQLQKNKILKYRSDYNNNPPTSVAFIPAMASTSGRLHSEFIRLLFLQAHQETDRFFAASGVQPAQSNHGTFHYNRTAFLRQLKSKIVSSLAKDATMRVNLNIDGTPITSRSHTHPSHSQASRLLTSSLSLGVPVPRTMERM